MGIIRFVDQSNPHIKYYLSRTLAPQGYIDVSQDRSTALQVEYSPSKTMSIKV